MRQPAYPFILNASNANCEWRHPDADLNEDERLRAAADLPARIRERKDALARDEALLQECRTRVLRLIERINEVR